MKHKKLKTPVIYYVFAGILLLILAFAGYQALKIYLPQLEESKGFESIKEEAGIKDISAQEIIGSTEPSQSGETDNKTENAADNTPVLTLTQKNSDFVGWLSIEDTVIDYPVMKSDESDPEFKNDKDDRRLSGFVAENYWKVITYPDSDDKDTIFDYSIKYHFDVVRDR